MKILCVGGPYDGKRFETAKVSARIVVPVHTDRGLVKHEYRHYQIHTDVGALQFYVHSNIPDSKIIANLYDRYPRGDN